MEIEVLRTEGLGDSTFVIVHDGVALVVDPQRDIDRIETILDAVGATPRFVVETHLHNDYLSGGNELARALGAEVVMPAGAAPSFRHRPAFHMEDLDAGPFQIRPMHTPGHTPEHTSYVVIIDGEPQAVFSGGSLLVGSAGRSDLLGDDRADSLARLQYHSVNRLAGLPDEVVLCPTHGAGSFCTASTTGGHTSTIGVEKKTNPVLAYSDEDSFAKGQLAALVPFPDYYRHMGPANLLGAGPMPSAPVPVLTEEDFAALDGEFMVVDGRPSAEFAKGHLPGSIGIGHRSDFGVWAGWVLPYDAELVIVLNPGQDVDELVTQLSRIGFDRVRGVVLDLPTWDRKLATFRTTTEVSDFADAVQAGSQIVDSRAPNEWELGIVRGSHLQYAPDVAADGIEEMDQKRDVWLACETGYRATIAASFAESAGYRPVVLIGAGIPEVLAELENREPSYWRRYPVLAG